VTVFDILSLSQTQYLRLWMTFLLGLFKIFIIPLLRVGSGTFVLNGRKDLLASRVIFLRTHQIEYHYPAKGTARKAEGPVFAY
jgi:hypothetical protein